MAKFDTLFPPGKISLFKGKKRNHVKEILFALGQVEPADTFEIARFALRYDPYYKG